MRRGRALALAALGAASLAAVSFACSSFSEEEVTPVEAGALDAATAADAADASVDAPAAPFCDMHPDASLCADFDEGLSFDTGFTSHLGQTEIDLDASSSAPGSLRVTGGADAASASVHYQAPPADGVTELHLEVDVLIQGYPAPKTDPRVVVFAGILPGPRGCRFALEYLTSGSRLDLDDDTDGGAPVYENFPFTAHPELGKWFHVVLTLSQTQNAVSATVFVDGSMALPPRLTTCRGLPREPDVYFGLYANTPAVVHYDNVLFTRK